MLRGKHLLKKRQLSVAGMVLILMLMFTPLVAVHASSDEWGGYTEASGDEPEGINELNEELLKYMTAAGVVVVALGVVKFIMSLSDHAPMGKVSASTMIALGLVLVGGSQILATANAVKAATTPQEQVKPIIEIVKFGFFWPGAFLTVVGIVKSIMSIMNERPEEKVEAGKMVGVGLALMGASFVVDNVADIALSDSTNKAGEVGGFIISNIIIPIAVITGTILFSFGMIRYAEAFKEEDAQGKSRAALVLITGLLLMSTYPILKLAFGIDSSAATPP